LEAVRSSRREAVGWAPSGLASSLECRAAQSRQARPEEAQEPSGGTAKGAKGAKGGQALWPCVSTQETGL
jgi:hypothetical protein